MASARSALAAALAALFLLGAPAAALGQLSPFQGGTPAPTQTTPPVTTTASSPGSSGGGLSTATEILIGAAGIALIGGIVAMIYYDSRRRAPVAAGETGYEESVTHPHRKKAQQRAKAKRAKASRRRNR